MVDYDSLKALAHSGLRKVMQAEDCCGECDGSACEAIAAFGLIAKDGDNELFDGSGEFFFIAGYELALKLAAALVSEPLAIPQKAIKTAFADAEEWLDSHRGTVRAELADGRRISSRSSSRRIRNAA